MSALGELERVMQRLRAPGGCPWDAEQTHASLVQYVIEEAYELAEAIEAREGADDPSDAHLREELGDVLLQVVFHAEIAREEGRFDLQDVAVGLVEKLVSRHPHVFGDASVSNANEVVTNWDALKRAEKPERESALDGIPVGLPALALAAKTIRRAERSGLTVPESRYETLDESQLGEALLALVRGAVASGLDPERALRASTRSLADSLRAQERGITRPGATDRGVPG